MANDVKEVKELSEIDQLLNKKIGGTITTEEKIKLASLLTEEVKKEANSEFDNKIIKLKEKAKELGLTDFQIFEAFKPALVLIIEYTDKKGVTHQRFKGAKGKTPAWFAEMKNNYLVADAKAKFAKNADGEAVIEKIYNPPAKAK